jgi:hypothetical protein
MHWDGANGFDVLELMEPETESEEMALSLSAEGPLTKLTWVKDSLVLSQLKICSFWRREKGVK